MQHERLGCKKKRGVGRGRAFALARAACAYWVNDGCIMREGGRCHLEAREGCSYFAKYILPLASSGVACWQSHAAAVQDFARIVSEREGVSDWAASEALAASAAAAARLCDCGQPLAPRKRFCERCRKAKRKAAWRDSQNRRRRGVNS